MISRFRSIEKDATGRRIAAYIRTSGMSVSYIAAYCMVGKQTVYKWRSGKTIPSYDQLATLAGLLRVRIDDLLVITERWVEHE